MIDERFSRSAFEASADPEALAVALRDEVLLAIDAEVKAVVARAVVQLNDLGHELADEGLAEPGEVCFDSPASAAVRLYVCHDSTVSIGTRRNRPS